MAHNAEQQENILAQLPGGQALIDWFGHVPRFHDAETLELRLASVGPSVIRIHAWRMTDTVDAQGFFVLDRHAVVTITLDGVRDIAIGDFDLPGIIFELKITQAEVGSDYTGPRTGVQLAWTGSYGVSGALKAQSVRFDLQPGKP